MFIAILLIGTVGMAQRGNSRGHRNLNPEQVATLQTKKMTLALDLTEVQQNAVQKLYLEQAEYRKSKMEERKERREKEEARPTKEERFEMAEEKLDRAIAHKAAMKEILSADQYEKWEKMQARKARHAKGKKGQHRGKYRSKG